MASGKHASDEEFDFSEVPLKKIGIFLGIIVLIVVMFFAGRYAYSVYNENKEKKKNEAEKSYEDTMPNLLYGHKVLGELKIESKNYSTYILDIDEENSIDTTSDEAEENDSKFNELINTALKYGVVKLAGNDINKIGNFCIIGHNEEKFFSVLDELDKNQRIVLKDQSKIEKKYIITDIYTVEPTDLKCLMPNKKYKEVTLITCATGSDLRLVVKAVEESDYDNYVRENALVTFNVEDENENLNNT